MYPWGLRTSFLLTFLVSAHWQHRLSSQGSLCIYLLFFFLSLTAVLVQTCLFSAKFRKEELQTAGHKEVESDGTGSPSKISPSLHPQQPWWHFLNSGPAERRKKRKIPKVRLGNKLRVQGVHPTSTLPCKGRPQRSLGRDQITGPSHLLHHRPGRLGEASSWASWALVTVIGVL